MVLMYCNILSSISALHMLHFHADLVQAFYQAPVPCSFVKV